MATIEKRTSQDGKPVYRVKIRRKGAPPLTATLPRLTDAKRWAQVTEGAVLEGRHFKTAEAKRHTLADLTDRYLREVLPRKSRSSIYMQTLQLNWWKAQLGQRTLADITPALLAEYREKLAQGEKQPRSNATVVRYMAALSHAFTIAVREWEWLEDSPMRKVSKPKEPRGRVRFLSDEERTRLLDACQVSHNPSLYTVVVLALATGARKGELLSLRWPDVDLKRGTLTFHQTKNGERRAVPLTGQALALMQQHAKVRRLNTQLVFPDATGTRPLSLRDAFEGAVVRAGISDFHFHDLRHTFASYLAMNGASLLEIAEALGHKTLAMVKRYAHLSKSHLARVVARMNATIFGGA
jgi:integrase